MVDSSVAVGAASSASASGPRWDGGRRAFCNEEFGDIFGDFVPQKCPNDLSEIQESSWPLSL